MKRLDLFELCLDEDSAIIWAQNRGILNKVPFGH